MELKAVIGIFAFGVLIGFGFALAGQDTRNIPQFYIEVSDVIGICEDRGHYPQTTENYVRCTDDTGKVDFIRPIQEIHKL